MDAIQNTPQVEFFQQILDKFPSNASAVTALSELLDIQQNGIYRRLKDDTSISLNEAMLLAKEYDISLDALRGVSSGSGQWTFSAFQQPVRVFDDFMNFVGDQAETIRKLDGIEILYASKDLPVFHAMQFPEILAFKLYTWGLTTWQLDDLQNHPFRLDMITEEHVKKANQIAKLYNGFDSQELWSDTILKSILRQIEYLAAIDLFSYESDAFLLCDRLESFMAHLQKMAERGKKLSVENQDEGGRFNLYHNETVHTNNIVLVKTESLNYVTTSFCNPNTLQSHDAKVVEFVENWMQQIIRHSNSISIHSPLERRQFFSRMEKDIAKTRQRLKRIFHKP